MNWKKNLAKTINKSGYSDRQISAWTGISTPVISNMSNEKQESLRIDQFIKLKLLFKKDHEQFVYEIFGKGYFSEVTKIEQSGTLTQLGIILTNQYYYERLPKKELSKATGLTSQRINYIIEEEDETIKIDELTKIELALDLPVGTLAKKRFSRIKLNTQRQYELGLKKLKE
jgi:DNA-binding Xre family transcriptional regulator